MSEWQPIETAPKDGTLIILWDSNRELAVSGHWHSEPARDDPSNGYEHAWSWWVSSNDTIMWDGGPDDIPTHWTPLPEPPK